jgi:FKBP-type peptidyl-prolyl cis-trans isomerase (trigger factor)
MDEAEFVEAEVRPAAIRRLERRLIMDELIESEKIQLDADALKDEFRQTWDALVQHNEAFNRATSGGTKHPNNLVQAVMLDITSLRLVQKTLERIKALANGEVEGQEAKPKKAAAKKTKASAETPAEETGAGSGSAEEPVEAKPKKRTAAKKAE